MTSRDNSVGGMPNMPEILDLAAILKKNGDKVLSGVSKLSLSTKLLHNLNDAFAMIVDDTRELDGSFQVCNSSVIAIFTDFKFLHDFVQKTVWLKVAQAPGDPKRSIDISKFRHLRFLELQKVSIDLVSGIQGVRGQLESITCTGGGGVCTVGQLLAACGGDAGIGFVWASLKRLALPYNGLGRLDKSLELAPWLQMLDLSHNLIVNAAELHFLEGLKYVNLGYNRLETAPTFNKATYHTLQVLVLKNNYIDNLNGLQGLESLRELDLSYNCLTDHSILWPLNTMSALLWISLEGNPLSYHKKHRILTIKHLPRMSFERKFILDREPLDGKEKAILSTNRKSWLRSRILPSEDDLASLSGSLRSDVTSMSVENPYMNDLTTSQASETIDTIETNVPRNRRKKQMREAVIDDNTATSVVSSTSYMEMSTEHLETKKQILELRQKFGNDNWLVSHAGSYVQDIMGLQSPSVPIFSDGLKNDFIDVSSPFNSIGNSPTVVSKSSTVVSNSPNVASSGTNSSSAMDDVSKIRTNAEDEPEKDASNDKTIRNESENIEKSTEVLGISPKIVEAPYDPEEEKGELFLVQKKSSHGEMEGLFLVITPENIMERDGMTGQVKYKWSTNAVLSCVMGRGEACSVDLIFDTTRNDRRDRTYFVEHEDATKIVKTLGELIKARPIVLNVFKCMKCSTHFSQDPNYVTQMTTISISDLRSRVSATPKCPTCRSTLVIQTDEFLGPDVNDVKKDTEESTTKNYSDEKFNAARDESPESHADEGNLQHSESHSSIGGTKGAAMPVTTSPVCFDSRPKAQISCSATSLDESRESTPSASTIAKRYESDIEVLSNPSQSSIEILDDGLKAISTPNRKRSSEERRIAIAPTLLTIPDTAPAMAGLTESSSSGSLTDSICTAYENKVSMVSGTAGKRQTRKTSETETLTNFGTTVTTPVGNLTSMLGGLLQSIKIGSTKNSPPKFDEGSHNLGSDIRYSYIDFNSVDHRMKLHLILNVFEQEAEDFVLLLRAVIVMQALAEPFQGCVVLSTSKIYVLRITGPEREDPQRWLHKEASWTMDRLRSFAPLPFKQGVLVEVQLPGKLQEEPANMRILCILQDFQRTSNFMSYLADLPLPPSCELDFNTPEQCVAALQSLLHSSKNRRDDDVIRLLALFSSAELAVEERKDKFKFGGLIITTSAILLTGEKIQWLLPERNEKPNTRTEQSISNLIEVMQDDCSLNLSFLDEVAGVEEIWTLIFVSAGAAEAVIKAIQPPWEELFSVPLQITIKTSDGNQL